jgi:hypothetical protein
MVAEEKIHQAFYELIEHDVAFIKFADHRVTLRVFEGGQKVLLTTIVFSSGSSFLPPSVRACIHMTPPFSQGTIKAVLKENYETGSVYLTHIGLEPFSSEEEFSIFLNEYCKLADKWIKFIEDHGKNDLVHAYVS